MGVNGFHMTYLSINESQVEWNAWVSWFGSSSCFLIGQVVLIELTWHWASREFLRTKNSVGAAPDRISIPSFLHSMAWVLYWDVLVWNVWVFVLDGIGVWEMGIGVLFSLFMNSRCIFVRVGKTIPIYSVY